MEEKEINLYIEWYDESKEDLHKLAQTFTEREDLYAVIGGLYSDNAKTLASILCRSDVTFMTLATTEELVRAFASTGNLWGKMMCLRIRCLIFLF